MQPLIKSLLFILGPLIVFVVFSATTAAQDKTVLQQDRNLTMKILARSMNQIKKTTDLADIKKSRNNSKVKKMLNELTDGASKNGNVLELAINQLEF